MQTILRTLIAMSLAAATITAPQNAYACGGKACKECADKTEKASASARKTKRAKRAISNTGTQQELTQSPSDELKPAPLTVKD